MIASYPFTSCPSGFTTTGTNDDWQCGMPSGASAPPGDHTGGGSLFGTNISGKANDCEDSTLTSPVVDLSAYAGHPVQLKFWHWYGFRACTPNGILCPSFVCNLDMSSYSGGRLEVFANGTWHDVDPTGGYGNGGQTISCSASDAACTNCALEGKTGFGAGGTNGVWNQATYDVSTYTSASFQFRFRFASHDAYGCYPKRGGWYVDDIEISTPSQCM